jgi:hypothetical protein
MIKRIAATGLTFALASSAIAQEKIPDLVGVWKGQGETVHKGETGHHAAAQEPTMTNQPFTITVTKQEGRRFQGTFQSPRSTSPFVGAVSRTGVIHTATPRGSATWHVLGPNKIEMCYVRGSEQAVVADCAEFTKQP